MWAPGSEFSPGWVTWRSNPEWIGWLPTPPDEDVQAKSADAINTAGGWIFVDAKKFAQGCSSAAMAKPEQARTILTQTQFVTEFDIESGIAVAVLPPYIVGPLVDIDLAVAPWPTWFLAQTLIDWNFIWNNFDVVVNVVYVDCPHPFHPPGNTIPGLGQVPPPGTSASQGISGRRCRWACPEQTSHRHPPQPHSAPARG